MVAELAELGEIVVRSAPQPAIGRGEVLLRTLAVGICGTDVKAFRRGHPYFQPPCVLGHELVGRVVAVSDGEVEDICGRRVACAPYAECGVCSTCKKGVGELCEHKTFVSGALQEYVRVPAEIARRGLVPLDSSVDDVTATLTEPVACALNGVERAAVSGHTSVLVVGGGPMGALLALISSSLGAPVLVSEICPTRGELLKGVGLSVINPESVSLEKALAASFGEGHADRVLVAVGSREVAEQAVNWASPGGVVLLFGGLPKGERMSVDPFAVHYGEVTLAGSFGFRLRHFHEAGRWVASYACDVAEMVTDVVPFQRVSEAFARAERGRGLKTVVSFDVDD